jgi:hypothetical protein
MYVPAAESLQAEIKISEPSGDQRISSKDLEYLASNISRG